MHATQIVVGVTAAVGLCAGYAMAQCHLEWSTQFAPPALVGNAYYLAVHEDSQGNALHAFGSFEATGVGGFIRNAGKWDGSKWWPTWDFFLDRVQAVSWDRDGPGGTPPVLVIGSYSPVYGSLQANYIAQWNGTTMSSLGSGMNQSVTSVTTFDPDGSGPQLRQLIAGGFFSQAGGAPAKAIAAWNGAQWSAIGFGLEGRVWTVLGVDAGAPGHPEARLYAAGDSLRASTSGPVGPVVVWDGQTWSHLGWLGDGILSTMVWFDEDAGGPIPPSLYVGGRAFTSAGGVPAINVARWDGVAWHALGDGLIGATGGATVTELVVFDEDGSGPELPVLYAVGGFNASGSQPLGRVARWKNGQWEPVPGAPTTGLVYDAKVFEDHFAGPGRASLYVSGGLTSVDGRVIRSIAAWDGQSWRGTGSEHTPGLAHGMESAVLATALYQAPGTTAPRVIAAGAFIAAGGVSARHIAQWDGAGWSPLGSGVGGVSGDVDPKVNALAVLSGAGVPRLIVGGRFQTADELSATNVAQWDGESWSAMGVGLGNPGSFAEVLALIPFDPDGPGPQPIGMVAGGDFQTGAARFVAFWDGSEWLPLGTTINAKVHALAVYQDRLVAGGDFGASGSPLLNRIAMWDGGAWSPLGAGLNGRVRALHVYDGALFAGGDFTVAGTGEALRVARWDGGGWSPVGSGFGAYFVHALSDYDSGSGRSLIAGGHYSNSGSTPVRGLARWNGDRWEELGGGTYGSVNSLLPLDLGSGWHEEPTLFIGGWFWSAGATRSSHFAQRRCRPCYPDCDPTTGPGLLDIFDFLCFGNKFHAGDPYACDCDTTTGRGVCDVFDFLCFGNAFSAGCP